MLFFSSAYYVIQNCLTFKVKIENFFESSTMMFDKAVSSGGSQQWTFPRAKVLSRLVQTKAISVTIGMDTWALWAGHSIINNFFIDLFRNYI